MRIIIGMMMMSDHLRGHGALPLAAPLIWHGLRHMAYGIAWGIAWGMAYSIPWGIWPTAYGLRNSLRHSVSGHTSI